MSIADVGAGQDAQGERGAATLLAALAMLILAISGLAFATFAQFETKIGVNHAAEVRAFQAAEAGARRVFREITDGTQSSNEWLAMTQPVRNAVAVDAAGTARYTVSILDNNDGDGNATVDSDGFLVIRSRGASGVGGAQATVSLLIKGRAPFVGVDAVAVKNSLKMSGNPTIVGGCGSVHVPVDPGVTGSFNVDASGDPIVEQGCSTSGESVSGDYYYGPPPPTPPQVAPQTEVPAREVPPIDPRDFGKYADYLLLDNGFAYLWNPGAVDPGTLTPCTSAPCVQPDPPGWTKHFSNPADPTKSTKDTGLCSYGWKMTGEVSSSGPARWTVCGSGESGYMTPGTFYVVGGATIGQDLGSPGSHYRLTLVTLGSIEISGNSYLHWDDLTTTTTPATVNDKIPQNTLLVAGRDIKLNGNPSQAFDGAYLAHEQLLISGDATIFGFLLVENANPNISGWPAGDGLVTESVISGNATITYNCGLSVPELESAPKILAWLPL